MNDRQIQSFLEAAKTLSFTKAAENLYLPQPAVSRYISSLEEELNVKLFVRKNTRNIYLSEEGKTYYNLFQRFEIEFEMIQAEITHSPDCHLNFGYNTGWDLSFFLPDILEDCRHQRPELVVDIKCLEFGDLLQTLYDSELDALLTMTDYAESYQDLNIEPITSIRRMILYSGKQFSQEEFRSPSDFYERDFFLVDDINLMQMMERIVSFFSPYHFVPKFRMVNNLETMIANVENGMGVVMMDEWAINIISNPNIQCMPMDSSHSISYIWHKNNDNPAIHLLLKALKEHFTNTKY